MKGLNTLTLCLSELQVAIQEYLEKRWTEDTPTIDSITLCSNSDRSTRGPYVDVRLKEGVKGE